MHEKRIKKKPQKKMFLPVVSKKATQYKRKKKIWFAVSAAATATAVGAGAGAALEHKSNTNQ